MIDKPTEQRIAHSVHFFIAGFKDTVSGIVCITIRRVHRTVNQSFLTITLKVVITNFRQI